MDKLRLVFSSVLGIPVEKIVPSLSPENTSAWDSLNAIVLITEIEKAFSMTFSYEEAMAVKDFAGVIQLLTAKGVNLNA